jgi:hypothetical protein
MSQVVPPVVSPEVAPLDRTLHPTLQHLQWVEAVASRWRFEEHINVLEVRALLTGVRWAASSPAAAGSRLVIWCDSMVVVFAVRKGRSSSRPLLRRLRALSAYLLALGIQLYCNWIPTEVNPADGPSRRYEFDSTLGFPGEGPRQHDIHHKKDFLIRASVRPATQRKYDAAIEQFGEWVDREGVIFNSVRELDEAVSEFCHATYVTRSGAGRSVCEAVHAALQRIIPEAKRCLHRSSMALKGWKNLVPPEPYPPLNRDLMTLVAISLTRVAGPHFGLATLLAFDCYLRAEELVSLRVKDVTYTGDKRMSVAYRGMALRLRHTKTGKNQWVCVRDPLVITLLRKLLTSAAPRGRKAKLFGFAAETYRRHFKFTCSDLGLSSKYVPHSLRHGGATHDYLMDISLEKILHRGRWASMKSARHYVQSGRALLLDTLVSDKVAELARECSRSLRACFYAAAEAHSGRGL